MADERAAFAGQITDLPVVELFRTVVHGAQTGQARFETNLGNATIWFRDGVIVDADMGRFHMEAAVQRLLTADSGSFEIEFKPISRRRLIKADTKTLLGLPSESSGAQLLPDLDDVFPEKKAAVRRARKGLASWYPTGGGTGQTPPSESTTEGHTTAGTGATHPDTLRRLETLQRSGGSSGPSTQEVRTVTAGLFDDKSGDTAPDGDADRDVATLTPAPAPPPRIATRAGPSHALQKGPTSPAVDIEDLDLPERPAPAQAAPVQASPVQAAPAQAAPVQAAPVQAAPLPDIAAPAATGALATATAAGTSHGPALEPEQAAGRTVHGLPIATLDAEAQGDAEPHERNPHDVPAPGRFPASRSPAGRSPASRSPASRSPAGRSPAGRSPAGRSPVGRSGSGLPPGAPLAPELAAGAPKGTLFGVPSPFADNTPGPNLGAFTPTAAQPNPAAADGFDEDEQKTLMRRNAGKLPEPASGQMPQVYPTPELRAAPESGIPRVVDPEDYSDPIPVGTSWDAPSHLTSTPEPATTPIDSAQSTIAGGEISGTPPSAQTIISFAPPRPGPAPQPRRPATTGHQTPKPFATQSRKDAIQPQLPPEAQSPPAPGGHVPGGHVPGGHVPGGHVPGGHVPGGHVPGGHVPGGHAPNRQSHGEHASNRIPGQPGPHNRSGHNIEAQNPRAHMPSVAHTGKPAQPAIDPGGTVTHGFRPISDADGPAAPRTAPATMQTPIADYPGALTASSDGTSRVGDIANAIGLQSAGDTAAGEPASSAGNAVVGRYEVLLRIARGGMGTVYLCRVTGAGGFRRLFALKVIRDHLSRNEEYVRMLLQEARIASRLHHPNIVGIVDIGNLANQHYLVMDYVEGCTFSELLKVHPKSRPPHLVIPIVLEALTGLQAAHSLTDDDGSQLTLVHCDFSPQNMLVGTNGICRITDFGIAKASKAIQERSSITRGKPAYLAPEQVMGHSYDHRADIFAAGVVLWNALTGEQLFGGDSAEEILDKVINRPIPAPSTAGLRPPRALDQVVLKALERDPKRRYQSAEQFLIALRRVAITEDLLAPSSEVAQWVVDTFGSQLQLRRQTAGLAPKAASQAEVPVVVPELGLGAEDSATHAMVAHSEGSDTRVEDSPSSTVMLRAEAASVAPLGEGLVARQRNIVFALAATAAGALIAVAFARPEWIAGGLLDENGVFFDPSESVSDDGDAADTKATTKTSATDGEPAPAGDTDAEPEATKGSEPVPTQPDPETQGDLPGAGHAVPEVGAVKKPAKKPAAKKPAAKKPAAKKPAAEKPDPVTAPKAPADDDVPELPKAPDLNDLIRPPGM